MQLKSNFNFLKERKHLSYRDISKKADINISTLSTLSHGEENNTRIEVVNKLAIFFQITLDDLVNKNLAGDKKVCTNLNISEKVK